MPLTHDFKETIRGRAQRDPAFRQALLREAVECILNGDLATGKAVLRDYVNATAGFQAIEKRTHIPAKSLMRMPGPKGSPSAANLTSILTALQISEGVQFELSLRRENRLPNSFSNLRSPSPRVPSSRPQTLNWSPLRRPDYGPIPATICPPKASSLWFQSLPGFVWR